MFSCIADDHLAARLDFLSRAVDVGNPVECLLRRCDVVAHRREEDDRRLDVAQIEGFCRQSFPCRRTTACCRRTGCVIHSISRDSSGEAAPPAPELEKVRGLGVDVRVQAIVHLSQNVFAGWRFSKFWTR